MKVNDNLFTLLFLCIPATWAGSFIAAKFVVADVAPLPSVFYRFFFSALVMFPGLILFRRSSHLRFSDKKLAYHLIFVSLLSGVAYHIFFFWALKFTTPTNAALIIALNPFFTAFGEIALFKQKRHPRFYLGFMLSFLGAVWVNLARDGSWQLSKPGKGELLCLLASLTWAVYTIFAKKTKNPEWDSMWINAYNYLITALLILPFVGGNIGISYFHHVTSSAWLGLFYMAIFPTAIGYTLFYVGVQRKGPAWAATFIYLVPSLTAVLDFIFFKAVLSTTIILGTLLVIIGLIIGNVKMKSLKRKYS